MEISSSFRAQSSFPGLLWPERDLEGGQGAREVPKGGETGQAHGTSLPSSGDTSIPVTLLPHSGNCFLEEMAFEAERRGSLSCLVASDTLSASMW